MAYKYLLALVAAALVTACGQDGVPVSTPQEPRWIDHFTYSNGDAFVTEHLHLDLDVDFEARELAGTATLQLRRIDDAADRIILDTHSLVIENVLFVARSGEGVDAEWSLGEHDDYFGAPLTILLPDAVAGDDELELEVAYRTSPDADALQWLPPELTAGGEHPLVFSQSQSIHARSWVPLQDTPAIRFTYSARITTPPELLAVMSANNDPDVERDGVYDFEMPERIPAYGLAIAVGNLYFAAIGEDTGVYAEPETLDAAAWEFADTQAMFETAEAMFGPYQWGRYDLLVLPPSFPYGGMENPRLSFLTPSLIAGDRSLVAVVAHELAHSWSGNLVTNKTWRDSWLNEGWTSYLEHRLMEVIYDEARAAEENVIGYRELLLDFESVPEAYQPLAPNLTSADRDFDQGIVIYHKGSLFLQWLEDRFGRDRFDPFINEYFNEFAFTSITSEQFLDFLDARLLSVHPGIVSRGEVEAWLYEPGLPANALIPTSANLDAAAAYARQWSQGEIDIAEVPAADWSPQAVRHFINNLGDDLSTGQLSELDVALGLSATGNAEIARTWFIQVAERRHTPAYEALEQHLSRYGRTRLIRPIYEALAANGADADKARQLFDERRHRYHPLTITAIERVLE